MSEPIPKPDYDLSSDLHWHTQGMSPAEKEAMRRAELAPEEAKRWAAVGVACPKVVWGWKVRGVEPEEGARWHAAGFLPDEADALRERQVGLGDLPLSEDERREARRLGLPLDRAYWFKLQGDLSVAQAAAWQALPFRPNGKIARAWIDAGFSPDEATAWWEARASNPQEAARWREAGFAPGGVTAWWEASFQPEEAGCLRELGLSPTDVAALALRGRGREWREAGIPLAEAVSWAQAGLQPREARAWRDAGCDAREAQAWRNEPPREIGGKAIPAQDAPTAALWRNLGLDLRAAQALLVEGLTAHEAQPWVAAGFTPREALALRRTSLDGAKRLQALGQSVESILAWETSGQGSQAADWISAGVAPDQAQAWSRAGVAPSEAGAWVTAGLSPEAAGSWRGVVRDPAQAAQALASA